VSARHRWSGIVVALTLVCVLAAPATGYAASTATPGAGSVERDGPWSLGAALSWQIQFTGELELDVDVDLFVLDLFDIDPAAIATLRDRGVWVICYVNAGSFEQWRPDVRSLPREVVGEPLGDWPGEFWWDIRSDAVRSLVVARFDLAVDKRCDGVQLDNVNLFEQETGFPIDADDQLRYNEALAREAHNRGLSAGLTNDLSQIGELADDFDFGLNESCLVYQECDLMTPFIDAGNPVLHIEYGEPDHTATVCPAVRELGFATLVKNEELDAQRTPCFTEAAGNAS
jgi:hypothetical protein